jgi:hypothetical protein
MVFWFGACTRVVAGGGPGLSVPQGWRLVEAIDAEELVKTTLSAA